MTNSQILYILGVSFLAYCLLAGWIWLLQLQIDGLVGCVRQLTVKLRAEETRKP